MEEIKVGTLIRDMGKIGVITKVIQSGSLNIEHPIKQVNKERGYCNIMRSLCTTLLPPYPPTVVAYPSPYDVPLPSCPKKLIGCLEFINKYINNIWKDYLNYCDSVPKPQAGKIFEILLREMEYFEELKIIVISKIPNEIMYKHGIPHVPSDW